MAEINLLKPLLFSGTAAKNEQVMIQPDATNRRKTQKKINSDKNDKNWMKRLRESQQVKSQWCRNYLIQKSRQISNISDALDKKSSEDPRNWIKYWKHICALDCFFQINWMKVVHALVNSKHFNGVLRYILNC